MPRTTPYHHGNLRAALIEAVELELAEVGLEAVTLRGTARRTGVSHSAPASFFKDIRALLTELAAVSFERLTERMMIARAAEGDPVAAMQTVGLAYAGYAVELPEQFRLIWRKERLDVDDPHYKAAAAAAFAVPVGCIGTLRRIEQPMANPATAQEVVALWAMIHGTTELLLNGQLDASGLGDRKTIARAVLPPMIGSHFANRPG